MGPKSTPAQVRALLASLADLRRRALEFEASFAPALAAIPHSRLDSARNLLHYLSLRQSDLRPLQADLAQLGLSSLGRMEPCALATLDAVLWALGRLCGAPAEMPAEAIQVDHESGPRMLQDNARALFGPEALGRPVRIMVTMPSEAATDASLVRRLLAAGMDAMRINCAHDGPDAWLAMIGHLRAAERAEGRSCRVYADLAGPKVRTGALPRGPRVLKVSPQRDARGTPQAPGRVWLTAVGRAADASTPHAAPGGTPKVPLEGCDPARLEPGDAIRVTDARGKRRELMVAETSPGGAAAGSRRSVYLETGSPFEVLRRGVAVAEGRIGLLPEVHEPLVLRVGERLVLLRDEVVGSPEQRDERGQVVVAARMHCTLPEAFETVRPGDAVSLDDGKLGGVAVRVSPDEIEVEVRHAPPRGAKLGAEKGVNFPDTELRVPALTAEDREVLELLAGRVDIFGLSFVRRPEDVIDLHERLAELGAPGTGLVLKIESRAAFQDLPRILLAALRFAPVGVMVARGDLAVEVGFERLSEVQEEILWLCEAAHVPVVWATQVLEGMAKKGFPSRAEVTDAAMGERAECVMLNKGPHVVEAVELLGGVLGRMHAHQWKKRAMLRPLAVARTAPGQGRTGELPPRSTSQRPASPGPVAKP